MPTKVSFQSSAPTSVKSLSFVLIPRREQVLASLRSGEKLDVEVLERFGDDKVMLKIKGAAVTAQAKGDFQVGEKVQARIMRQGNTLVLQRVDSVESELEKSLVRVIRSRLGGMEERALNLTSLMNNTTMSALAGAKSGFAGLLGRLQSMIGEMFVVDAAFSEKLANLAVTLGLSPAGVGDRMSELFGRNLPGMLQKVLSASKEQWVNLLKNFPQLSMNDVETVTSQAGQLKEQIGLFRALNGLFATRDLPQFMTIPFLFNGQPQPTDIWIYKRQDKLTGKDDPDTVSAYLKLNLSNIGEVRAMIVVQGKAVQARIFTENKTAAESIRQSLPDLTDHLEEAGLKPRVNVVDSLVDAPDENLHKMIYASGNGHALSMKI